MVTISFGQGNALKTTYSTLVTNSQGNVVSSGPGEVGIVSDTLFGGISINTRETLQGDSSQIYEDHYAEAYDYMSLTYVRYPDGELPDGFAVKSNSGEWTFKHNDMNNGGDEGDIPTHPVTGAQITAIDQALLNSLSNTNGSIVAPAFSLKYPDLFHPGLLESATGDDKGRMGFSEALEFARANNSAFSVVLPEFQYLKAPVDRDLNDDGNQTPFNAVEHVKLSELKSDVKAFLKKLFVDGAYNNGQLPDDIIIEIGNEDFFGWDKDLVQVNTPDAKDIDSFSAFLYGALDAIEEFRSENPSVEFKVSMQANGYKVVKEIDENFQDMNTSAQDTSATDLFAQVDVIDTIHHNLDSTLTNAYNIEDKGALFESPVKKLLELIVRAGGSIDEIEFLNSAWSANSNDVFSIEDIPFGLPAASTALSAISGLAELGMDYSAFWGVGAWNGFGTNATASSNGIAEYAPYGEALRLMAESLPGTWQLDVDERNSDRSDDYALYAYEDSSKGVIFIAANGDAQTVTVDLQGFGTVAHAWGEKISSTGTQASGFTTEVTRQDVPTSNGSFTVTLQPYEVIRVIVAKEAPGTGYLHLVGTAGGDSLEGGQADDLLEGEGGADILHGRDGDDTLDGGAGNDTIYGNYGNDTLIGGGGNDWLVGGFGDDVIKGGNGDDTLKGYAGKDILHGGGGDDVMQGFEGNDIYKVDSLGDVIHEADGDGSDRVDSTITLDLRDFVVDGTIQDLERLTLLGSNDLQGIGNNMKNTIKGNGGDNRLNGLGGSDTLLGNGGADRLFGGGGQDTLNGGAGNDELTGGFLDDTFVFSGAYGQDIIHDFDALSAAEKLDLSDVSGVGVTA